jgi:lipoprotein-anchoring transpeptidase ErfK/SrfK
MDGRWRGWWAVGRRAGRLLAAVAVCACLLMPGTGGVVSAEEQWVQSHLPATLWSGPQFDAVMFGKERKFSYFRVHGPQEGGRIYVFNPRTENFAWVDAHAVGPSTPPPESYLAVARPKVLEQLDVPARAVGTASLWQEPIQDDTIWVKDVWHNAPLHVEAAVKGGGDEPWYRLSDGTYVQADQVRLPQPRANRRGRWIDVTLSSPTLVTAYEDGRPVFTALAIRGIGGWETPVGTFVIQSRVANERMRGPGWDVSNVLFTQYFTGSGHSFHYNYWSSNWGYAGSHGCLGMTYDDSLWLWHWAGIGTPVVIHW